MANLSNLLKVEQDGAFVPVLSFGASGDNAGLTPEEFNIRGNLFTAYYDDAHKLIFAFDQSDDADGAPNALLVINSPDGRKWDEILSKDYGLALETIRPKKNNLYQKLDIEYTGLSIYNALIAANAAGGNTDNAIAELLEFRKGAARRAAQARLDAALDTIDKASETVDAAKESVNRQTTRQKALKSKLSSLRKKLGREPAKESAAKILKVESQIEAGDEKMKRLRTRVRRAESRRSRATRDADRMREFLDREEPIRTNVNAPGYQYAEISPKEQPSEFKFTSLNLDIPSYPDSNTDDRTRSNAPLQSTGDSENKLYEQSPKSDTIIENTVAEYYAPPVDIEEEPDMAEDKEVKPLFESNPDIVNSRMAFQPIDFDAPEPAAAAYPQFDPTVNPVPQPTPQPVTTPQYAAASVLQYAQPAQPEYAANPTPAPAPERLTTVMPPKPTYANSPVERPASPYGMGGGSGGGNIVSSDDGGSRKKPSAMYYFLLIILILLSIFTLWLYQKKSLNSTPDITVPGQQIIEPEPIIITPTPAPVVIPEPEPIFVPVPDSEPIFVPEPVAPIQPVYAEPPLPVFNVVGEAPKPEAPYRLPPEAKQAYEVEGPKSGGYAVDYYQSEYDYNQDASAFGQPAVPDQMIDSEQGYGVAEQTFLTGDAALAAGLCEDGTAPDNNGCCSGELFSVGTSGAQCCPPGTSDCFPPILSAGAAPVPAAQAPKTPGFSNDFDSNVTGFSQTLEHEGTITHTQTHQMYTTATWEE
ncbi:hypothetical protein FACS189421_06990 [Bacteroidia bacterium]|nr:hypothetical protein FACS189421_06990 [Bacteroidia bacterium]